VTIYCVAAASDRQGRRGSAAWQEAGRQASCLIAGERTASRRPRPAPFMSTFGSAGHARAVAGAAAPACAAAADTVSTWLRGYGAGVELLAAAALGGRRGSAGEEEEPA
jgi:hypothetical protein